MIRVREFGHVAVLGVLKPIHRDHAQMRFEEFCSLIDNLETRYGDLTHEEKTKVLGGNAAKLYRIDI